MVHVADADTVWYLQRFDCLGNSQIAWVGSESGVNERLIVGRRPTQSCDYGPTPAEPSGPDGEMGRGAKSREEGRDSGLGHAASGEEQPRKEGDSDAEDGDGSAEVGCRSSDDTIDVWEQPMGKAVPCEGALATAGLAVRGHENTVHKVRQVDGIIPTLGVGVSEHPGVWKVPTEGIGDDDDDGLRRGRRR